MHNCYLCQPFDANKAFDINHIHKGLAMADAGGLAEIELPLQTEGLVLEVPEEVTWKCSLAAYNSPLYLIRRLLNSTRQSN